MPRTNPIHYLRRTNKPNTCKWCGRPTSIIAESDFAKNWRRAYGLAPGEGVELEWHFCTLSCCEYFAAAMIKNGYLLQPYEGIPWEELSKKGAK